MSAGDSGQDFPEACLRGIRVQKWIVAGPEGDVLSADAYKFDPAPRIGLPSEGWHEASVNWEDDADAVAFTTNQRSMAGNPLNPHGVGRLSVVDIERCRLIAKAADRLRFERREEPGNPYHGNLLSDPTVAVQFQRLLSGVLGLATRVVP
jgi:hypothetical protein